MERVDGTALRLYLMITSRAVTRLSRAVTATAVLTDYATLGRVADRIRILGYNLHGATGTTTSWPAPPSSSRRTSWRWGCRPTDGTGPNRSVDKARAKHVTWKEAEALRAGQGAPYSFDEVSGTPYFTYADGGKTREVWYQDARGVATHLPVLRKHGVTRTVLWALGFEDPRIWPVLADR